MLMETSPKGCVHGEHVLGALEGFTQDIWPHCSKQLCLTPRDLAGPSFPPVHSYKTSRDKCPPSSPKQVSSSHPVEHRTPSKGTETTRSAQT